MSRKLIKGFEPLEEIIELANEDGFIETRPQASLFLLRPILYVQSTATEPCKAIRYRTSKEPATRTTAATV